jgi:hypothetical protein
VPPASTVAPEALPDEALPDEALPDEALPDLDDGPPESIDGDPLLAPEPAGEPDAPPSEDDGAPGG